MQPVDEYKGLSWGLQDGGAMYLGYATSATLSSCSLRTNRAGQVSMHVLEADCAQEGAGMLR